jgi:3-deoxy-D-manno-octulosonic-acid transferase
MLYIRDVDTAADIPAGHHELACLPRARAPSCAVCGSYAASALQSQRLADLGESHAKVEANIKQAHECVRLLLERLRCATEEVRRLTQLLAIAERCSEDEAALAQTMREVMET